MRVIIRVVLSGFTGAAVCATVTFFLSVILMLLDGTRTGEAFFYSLIVAILVAFIGAFIGVVVGIGNLGLVGGGLVGLLSTLAIGLFYVLSFSRPGQYGYFLSESTIIFVVSLLPTVLAGVATAFLKNRLQLG